MQKRIITGIIGIFFLLLIIYLLPIYFFYALLFIVLLISHYEFYNLFNHKDKTYLIFSTVFCLLFIFGISQSINNIILILIFLFLFIFSIAIFSVKQKYSNLPEILKLLIGNIYITFFLSLSIPIFDNGNGKNLIMFILLIAWSTDSFAYFSGIKFGKNKLCPNISPNKTVEGAIGGICGALIIGLLFNIFILKFSFLEAFFVILILSISCILGDLFESALKRYNNKKDSGALFPGHGGMLDRIDSLFFAIPVFYILNKLF